MISRRNLFGIAAAAAATAVVPAGSSPVLAKRSGLRLSVEKGDPGYAAWCKAMGDRKEITVYLDGVEQKAVVTADELTGMVKRAVYTAAGNLALDPHRGEILHEEVFGDVRIIIADGAQPRVVEKAYVPLPDGGTVVVSVKDI